MRSDNASGAVDIEALRGWIGRQAIVTDTLTEDLSRKYHAMLDIPGDAPPAGEPAPRLIHFCLAQPSAPSRELGTDGHPARGGFLPPGPLPRRMWAGGEIVFHGDLHVGDTIHRTSRIEDVTLKHGRSGTLCFVTVRHAIEVDGRVAIEERQDLVYREAEAATARANVLPEASRGTHTRTVMPTPTLLFRYSALTFNGHRIHYDRPYAMEVEDYPGLVVHGPLQAALLLGFATEMRGTPPGRFVFRGASPLFDGNPFALNAADDGQVLKLWTAAASGPVAMSAEAHWSSTT